MLAPSVWGLPSYAQFCPACSVAPAAGLIRLEKQYFQHAKFTAAAHGLAVSSVLQKSMENDKIVRYFKATCSEVRQVQAAENACKVTADHIPAWLPAALTSSADCQVNSTLTRDWSSHTLRKRVCYGVFDVLMLAGLRCRIAMVRTLSQCLFSCCCCSSSRSLDTAAQ